MQVTAGNSRPLSGRIHIAVGGEDIGFVENSGNPESVPRLQNKLNDYLYEQGMGYRANVVRSSAPDENNGFTWSVKFTPTDDVAAGDSPRAAVPPMTARGEVVHSPFSGTGSRISVRTEQISTYPPNALSPPQGFFFIFVLTRKIGPLPHNITAAEMRDRIEADAGDTTGRVNVSRTGIEYTVHRTRGFIWDIVFATRSGNVEKIQIDATGLETNGLLSATVFSYKLWVGRNAKRYAGTVFVPRRIACNLETRARPPRP